MTKFAHMEVTLDTIPDTARLWIYQADRPFTPEEEEKINELTGAFVSQWAAHGQPLKATFEIKYHQFIILAVDEGYHQASGCSIDASVGLIRQIENQLKVNLLDRTKIAFLDGERVVLIPMKDLKEAVGAGKIGPETKIFNNMIDRASDWKTKWLEPAKHSWMSRYF